MKSTKDCQSIIFNLGIKHGVSPKLISTRLLSTEDKQDMIAGVLTPDIIAIGIECWMSSGMPDYANGKTEPLRPSYD